jgi:hypothetical protein
MAVQLPPHLKALGDAAKLGETVTTNTLAMSAPNFCSFWPGGGETSTAKLNKVVATFCSQKIAFPFVFPG